MSTSTKLEKLGQIARDVSDVARSREWYTSVLGLTHLYSFGDLAFLDCGGTRLMLNQNESAKNRDSILYFQVQDIDAVHRSLSRQGVEFIQAPHRIHTHEDGTEEWMAFLQDPDGRPLGLMSQISPRA